MCPPFPHTSQPERPDPFSDTGFPLPWMPSCPTCCLSFGVHSRHPFPAPHSPKARVHLGQQGHCTRTNRAIKFLPPAPHFLCPSLSVLLRKTHPYLPSRGHVDPLPASPFIRGTPTPFAVVATPDRPLREGRPGARLWSVSHSAQGRTSPSGHPWLSSWLKLGAVLQVSEQGWL